MEICPFVKQITTIVSGTAKGIDTYGELYVFTWDLEVVKFPADWARYGRGAGHIRNKEMADFAEALVAVWDGKSPGTKNMIANARKLGLLVFVYDASTQDWWMYNHEK